MGEVTFTMFTRKEACHEKDKNGVPSFLCDLLESSSPSSASCVERGRETATCSRIIHTNWFTSQGRTPEKIYKKPPMRLSLKWSVWESHGHTSIDPK